MSAGLTGSEAWRGDRRRAGERASGRGSPEGGGFPEKGPGGGRGGGAGAGARAGRAAGRCCGCVRRAAGEAGAASGARGRWSRGALARLRRAGCEGVWRWRPELGLAVRAVRLRPGVGPRGLRGRPRVGGRPRQPCARAPRPPPRGVEPHRSPLYEEQRGLLGQGRSQHGLGPEAAPGRRGD